MTRLRIVVDELDLARGGEFRRDVRPDDDLGCLAILRNEAKARGLAGDWTRYRIEAFDPQRGWLQHRPPHPP